MNKQTDISDISDSYEIKQDTDHKPVQYRAIYTEKLFREKFFCGLSIEEIQSALKENYPEDFI